ncbi:hypothetical protein BJ684DRAFT_16269 [Piptocephalis cylindrospora]|uniref:Uncharacterized protein n=1 Tax=Piptocephalis cylindrospora TaxID=1907219 RepID=A0A4P9Y3Q0_9FUNG|nr:hypothetical protein BJ684DRAFT_16269 [Piptocephalis cylindrospora]|eukprot:RKP13324.1 hypothetical protein BJ684DRAFT_16269 [Piptocephalis cylindrospora]
MFRQMNAPHPVPQRALVRNAMPVYRQDMDQFLSVFKFEQGTARVVGCTDVEKAVYGGKAGEEARRTEVMSESVPMQAGVECYADVDSIMFSAMELEARGPIRIYPNPGQFYNMSGSHLYVQTPFRGQPIALARTPHCLFGEGNSWVTVHAVFPSLGSAFHTHGNGFMSGPELDVWYDHVVLEAMRRVLHPQRIQYMRGSRRNAADFRKTAKVGMDLQAGEFTEVVRAIRVVVRDTEYLEERFGDMFFHVSCKGIKGCTTIPLWQLDGDEGEEVVQWRDKVLREHLSMFELGRVYHRIQMDVGFEFFPEWATREMCGPTQVLWKRNQEREDPTVEGPVRFHEYWLMHDVAGRTVEGYGKDVVNFGIGVPRVSYLQMYHVDKMATTGNRDHPLERLRGKDMRWGTGKFKRLSEVVMDGVVESGKISWAARREIRVSGRDFEMVVGVEVDAMEIMAKNPRDHFYQVGSLDMARFKAASIWLVQEGTRRVDEGILESHGRIGKRREAFMDMLAGMFRGYLRGVYYSRCRKAVFGHLNREDHQSLGLGWALRRYNRPYLPRNRVDWEGAQASLEGLGSRVLQDHTETMADTEDGLGVAMDEEESRRRLLEGVDRVAGEEDLVVEDPVQLAQYVIELLRVDLVEMTRNYQAGRPMKEWSLAQVRLSIPRRLERPISNRRKISNWRDLFEHVFPQAGILAPNVSEKPMWKKVKYYPAYLAYRDTLLEHYQGLEQQTYQTYQDTLWVEFSKFDCMVRSWYGDAFASKKDKNLYIDIRPH